MSCGGIGAWLYGVIIAGFTIDKVYIIDNNEDGDGVAFLDDDGVPLSFLLPACERLSNDELRTYRTLCKEGAALRKFGPRGDEHAGICVNFYGSTVKCAAARAASASCRRLRCRRRRHGRSSSR